MLPVAYLLQSQRKMARGRTLETAPQHGESELFAEPCSKPKERAQLPLPTETKITTGNNASGDDASTMKNVPRALLIMPDSQRVAFRGICNRLGIDTLEVETCQQTRELFAAVPEIDLVLTDVTLPDGNWCDVLRYVVENGSHSAVLLRCAAADEKLWSEALWRGVFDLVIEPYDTREVRRIIDGALRNQPASSKTTTKPAQR